MTDKFAPQARYDANNTRQISLKLNLRTDADILDRLEREQSKQGFIKQAIREKIEKEQKEGG